MEKSSWHTTSLLILAYASSLRTNNRLTLYKSYWFVRKCYIFSKHAYIFFLHKARKIAQNGECIYVQWADASFFHGTLKHSCWEVRASVVQKGNELNETNSNGKEVNNIHWISHIVAYTQRWTRKKKKEQITNTMTTK